MSEFPETIWVNINDSEDGCCPVEDEHFGDGRFYDPDTATEYRRADLSPTLSAAMELPEIRALVETMERAIEAIDAAYDGPDDNGAYTVRERAALAAIKEPKT